MTSIDQSNRFRFRPLIKPYSGVGAAAWQRHLRIIVSLAFVAIAVPYGFFYAITTPWLLVEAMIPIAILMALVLWALPEARTAPEKALERLTFAVFIALGLWPTYIAVDLPGLPWITPLRLFATPLVLVLLMSISTTPAFRTRLRERLNAAPVVWGLIAVLAVAELMSIPFSKHIGDTISKYIIYSVNEIGIFFVSCYVFSRPGRIEVWAKLFWACAMVITAVALFEYAHEQVPWAGELPGFLSVDPLVAKILAGVTRSTTEQYRAQSIFSTPLHLSEYLAYALPFILHIAAHHFIAMLVKHRGL